MYAPLTLPVLLVAGLSACARADRTSLCTYTAIRARAPPNAQDPDVYLSQAHSYATQ